MRRFDLGSAKTLDNFRLWTANEGSPDGDPIAFNMYGSDVQPTASKPGRLVSSNRRAHSHTRTLTHAHARTRATMHLVSLASTRAKQCI